LGRTRVRGVGIVGLLSKERHDVRKTKGKAN